MGRYDKPTHRAKRTAVMRRIALVSDVRDWAFDVNLRDLAEYALSNPREYHVDFLYVAEYNPAPKRQPEWGALSTYDTVFTPYHRWTSIEAIIPWRKTVGSLRSQWFRTEKPGPPTAADIAIVKRFQSFHVVTQRNYDELKGLCPNVVYLTNPVNTERFNTFATQSNVLLAEWNGSSKRDNDAKGLTSVIRPACATANVALSVCDYTESRLPHSYMPHFYARSNVALSASLFEGASNSVMEAMACGLVLVTTDCGNVRELQESQLKHFGDTGIVIADRNPEAFAQVLKDLQRDMHRVHVMGRINQREIRARWSWYAWADRYREFISTPWT